MRNATFPLALLLAAAAGLQTGCDGGAPVEKAPTSPNAPAAAGSQPAAAPATRPAGWREMFPSDSLDEWRVSHWSDVAAPQRVEGTAWKVDSGVLYGLGKRTWLYSLADYGDFELEFEVRISRGANGGVGLRFPPQGDPAYRGIELQVVDHEVYYRGRSRPEQRTGSIYDEIAADNAPDCVGKWTAWHVTARGSRITVVIDGRTVLDADLAAEKTARQQKGPALAERPRRGRIGFQNLNGLVTFRRLRIRPL